MESLLLLLVALACPLMMGALGVGAWLWAKMRGAAPTKFERGQGEA
jgi:hypothetical protein